MDSRSDVNFSTRLTPEIEPDTPLLSAPMDTVTGADAAEDLGLPIIADDDIGADEGVEGFTEYKGPLGDVADEFCAGIRSGLSYCGGHTTEAARETAEFIRVEQAAKEREGAHGDHDWKTVVDD